MSELTVYLNGEFIPYERAVVPVDDRGFTFADAVYEVIRCYNSRTFRFDMHFQRLHDSAAALKIPLPFDAARLRAVIDHLLRQNGIADASAYVQVSRGSSVRQHLPADSLQPTSVVIVRAADRPDAARIEHGVAVITVPDNRWGLCHIKTVGLLPNVLARWQAERAGAQDAIFVRDGLVTEASSSNVFCVLDGVVFTHPLANILPGVTRSVVLEIAAAEGIPFREEALPLDTFKRADEIFLTGTMSEITGVATLDGQPVGAGRTGPITLRIRQKFCELVRAETGAII